MQLEWVHSPFTPASIDPAVDAGFSHLTSARFGSTVIINVRSG